jgi:ribosomal protein S25
VDALRTHLRIFTGYAIFIGVVNIAESVKIAGDLEPETLRILRALPGVAVEADRGPGDVADAVLYAAGTTTPLMLEVKRRLNAATARMVIEQADGQSEDLPVLVVAAESTVEAREILRRAGIGVVDGAGNAHVELPGVLVHIEGRTGDAKRRAMPVRLSGKAGAVAQALLVDRERAWKVTDLAERTQVSVGLAHRVLKRLEGEGVVRAEGTGPGRTRYVDNPAALLDLWAEEQQDRPLRTRAFLLAETTRQAIDALGMGLEKARIDHALTGAAGASLRAPAVTAVPVIEVWAAATEAPERLCEAVGAEAVADGHNVVFLQADGDHPMLYREQVEGRWVASPLRLYVDLLQAPQRGREQARYLRSEVIGF